LATDQDENTMTIDKYIKTSTKGANVVLLSGWLLIEKVMEIGLNGRTEQALQACVMTRRPPLDGSKITKKQRAYGFPVLLTGTQASIVLDCARENNILPRVVAEGKLLKVPEPDVLNMLVHIKYLDILDAGNGQP